MSDQDLTRFLSGLKGSIEQALAQMPNHQDFPIGIAGPATLARRDPGNPS